MRPLDGDVAVLSRAGRRCSALALELHQLEKALGGAADSTLARWSGAAAASFGAMTQAHRGTVQGVRTAVERLGAVTSSFAHELAEAQVQAKRLPEDACVERRAIEERIRLLRKRFQQQATQVESDVKQLLLRRAVDPPRWIGPIRPPGGWGRGWPYEPPPLSGPVRDPGDRWNWKLEPPPLSGPPTSVQPLPTPAGRRPGATQLPWTPPWLNGSGDGPTRTLVQPVVVGA